MLINLKVHQDAKLTRAIYAETLISPQKFRTIDDWDRACDQARRDAFMAHHEAFYTNTLYRSDPDCVVEAAHPVFDPLPLAPEAQIEDELG